jgi:hypothetical protein
LEGGVCFRSYVHVESPRYMQYLFGRMTKTQEVRHEEWVMEQLEERMPNKSAAGNVNKIINHNFLHFSLRMQAVQIGVFAGLRVSGWSRQIPART